MKHTLPTFVTEPVFEKRLRSPRIHSARLEIESWAPEKVHKFELCSNLHWAKFTWYFQCHLIIFEMLNQRVLNALQRTRLSCDRMIRLLAHPRPPSPVSDLTLFLSITVCCRSSLLTGERGGDGAKLYDSEEAWPSINHSILSV